MTKRIGSTRGDELNRTHGRREPSLAAHVKSAPCLALIVMASWLAPSVTAQDLRPDVAERVKHATIMVFNFHSKNKKNDTPIASGSGFFINSTGMAITNNHVVDPTHDPAHTRDPGFKQRYHYTNGRITYLVVADAGTEEEKTYDADVLYQNEFADQAILQVLDTDGEKLETPNYLHLLPNSRLKDHMKTFALGFPGGDKQRRAKDKHPEVTITVGHTISIPWTPGGRIRMVYTDINVRPGNSGGPVVNLDGYLVGTATLMTKPKDREDTGGANYSALVPAKITADMIRYAFDLHKLPDASDVIPFMDMLTQEDGHLRIAEFRRLRDKDALFHEDGDEDHGTFETKTITWDSPLGQLEVPTTAVAYIMNNDEGSHLFLEGGNRISAEEVDATVEFTPMDGTKTTMSVDDVQVIGLRTSGRDLHPVEGKVLVLDSDLTHLVLSEVKGKVEFEGKSTVHLGLEQIDRIDTNDDDDQVVTLRDGRRTTGQFSEDKFKATIAATRTPIEFGLNEVTTATIEVRFDSAEEIGGRSLREILASAGSEVRELLHALEESNDTSKIRARLDKMVSDKKAFRKRSLDQKEQIMLLDAVANLRAGDSVAAAKLFRKAKKANNDNIAAYALACGDVLKQYEDFKFKNKPLSDKNVFIEAGQRHARNYIREARDAYAGTKTIEGKNRGEYFTAINTVKKNEPNLQVAAVFIGTEAEDELLRLWKLGFDVATREYSRVTEEIQEKSTRRSRPSRGARRSRGSRGSRGGRGGGAQAAAQREVEELNKHLERVVKVGQEYFLKMLEYGFRIEDPDIQQQREQLADRSRFDEDDPDEP